MRLDVWLERRAEQGRSVATLRAGALNPFNRDNSPPTTVSDGPARLEFDRGSGSSRTAPRRGDGRGARVVGDAGRAG